MRFPVLDAVAVDVSVRGGLPPDTAEYARGKVTALIRRGQHRVLYARVRVTRLPDPAVPRPVVAQVNLDVNGRPVCAQVAAGTGREAVDLLVDRLHRQLSALAAHWEARRGRQPVTIRHGPGR